MLFDLLKQSKMSGCIFVLVNSKKIAIFSSKWKRRNYTEQCAPFNTNMMKSFWDFHLWLFHSLSFKNIITAKCTENTSMRSGFSQVIKINNSTWGGVFALGAVKKKKRKSHRATYSMLWVNQWRQCPQKTAWIGCWLKWD